MNGLGRRQTQNADAYDAYLRGRYQAHRRTAEGNARAIELYKRAIAIDPNYALAWADLAFVYAAGAINGDARPAVVGPRRARPRCSAVRANPESVGSAAGARIRPVAARVGLDGRRGGAPAGRFDLDPSNAHGAQDPRATPSRNPAGAKRRRPPCDARASSIRWTR